jgi:hypothetical protein
LVAGWLGKFGSYRWKGRKIKWSKTEDSKTRVYYGVSSSDRITPFL